MGIFKWNVDGSVFGKMRDSGIGGILCDGGGNILCFFSVYTIRDFNEAEFLVILFVFEIIISKSEVMGYDIILESDSKNVIFWVSDRDKCLWKLRLKWNKLSNM